MKNATARQQWEAAAPGWARWEPTIASWMGPATEVMLAMAGVEVGTRVVDLASGAGSQTLLAAQRVGSDGEVVANDIADTMLRHVEGKARSAGLSNVTTVLGAAEELYITAGSFDAVVCRLGLMLFVEPATALAAMHHAGGQPVHGQADADPVASRGKGATGAGETRDLRAGWSGSGSAAAG